MRVTPDITVIVPVCNVRDHVGACIGSLRAQTWPGFEAIVIDDGSTDDSLARLRRAIGGDPRFRVIARDNRGLSAARNIGLAQPLRRFVGFLDSDDRYAPDFLRRMRAALLDDPADWVACAVSLCFPGGTSQPHSAIHGMPGAAGLPDRTRHDLTDWRQVVRHFPSAWNKLYRRDLIADLRFDEDTCFEDQAFFLRAAARTGALLHLSTPLYQHTRARPGQITSDDSDRVFDQIRVLERLVPVFEDPGKTHGRPALARLSSRVLSERAAVIRSRSRRHRFVTAAAGFLHRSGLRWDDSWDATLPAAFGLELAGHCPLTVIVPWSGAGAELCLTLRSLADQTMRSFETLICVPNQRLRRRAAESVRRLAPGPARVHLTGRAAGALHWCERAGAKGVFVTVLTAGDRIGPDTLLGWSNAMIRQSADFGVADHTGQAGQPNLPFRAVPRDTACVLPHGWIDRLDPGLAGKVFRRSWLQAHGLWLDGPGCVFRAAQLSRRTVRLPQPCLRPEAPNPRFAAWRRGLSALAQQKEADPSLVPS